MIKPKEIVINGKKFSLTKFPAIEGREIATQYIASGLPKLGDYRRNEELMKMMMKYVYVHIDGIPPVSLSTDDLINNHTEDWETLIKLEKEMLEYNCSFLTDGRASTLLDGLASKALTFLTKMSINSSESSLVKEKQASVN